MNDERGTMNNLRSSFIVHRSSFLLALLLLVALNASALDVPPPPTQWFTDTANIVDSSSASALNEKLRNFEQSSGAQFIIYIFPSLEGESMEDFTIHCAEKWKVGNKKYDNGLILFVFVKERKVRIEVGYGLEGTVTDAISSRVIRDDIAPHFQKSDYAGGLNAAADDLIARIQGKEAPVAPVRRTSRRSSSSDDGFNVQCFLLLVVLFFVFVLPYLTIGRRRRASSGCGGCFWPLLFMSGGRGITFGGGGGFGGFSGGGGSFGGGGASGGW
jgi:uncharacterized protein